METDTSLLVAYGKRNRLLNFIDDLLGFREQFPDDYDIITEMVKKDKVENLRNGIIEEYYDIESKHLKENNIVY